MSLFLSQQNENSGAGKLPGGITGRATIFGEGVRIFAIILHFEKSHDIYVNCFKLMSQAQYQSMDDNGQ